MILQVGREALESSSPALQAGAIPSQLPPHEGPAGSVELDAGFGLEDSQGHVPNTLARDPGGS